MKLYHLSDSELLEKTEALAEKEQETTLLLLSHLQEVERRRLYLRKGYVSLWEYVQKALHYSESQTGERISAMRLIKRDEAVKEALETRALTLTQAAMTERVLRAEEKEIKAKVSREKVQDLLTQIQGQSKRETEKVLLTFRPKTLQEERIEQKTESLSQIQFSITEETRKQMERYWELKGKGSLSDLFAQCLAFYLEQKDSLQTEDQGEKNVRGNPQEFPGRFFSNEQSKTLPATWEVTLPVKFKKSRYIPVQTKKTIRERAQGQCEFVDSETKRRCESRYLLQFDHIYPFTFGGDADPSNLRQLCAVHNRHLGKTMFRRVEEIARLD